MTFPLTFISIDFETTHRNPNAAGFVEVAIARVVAGVVVDRWQSLANPGFPCSDGAEGIHGITQAEIDGAPSCAELVPEIAGWLADGDPIVAYNGPAYDKIILRRAFEALGADMPTNDWIDPYRMAQKIVPGLGGYKLGQVGAHFGIFYDPGMLHRAMADVDLTIGIYLALVARAAEAPELAPQRLPPIARLPPPTPATSGAAEPAPFLAPAIPAAVAPAEPTDDTPALVLAARVALKPLKDKALKWIEGADALPCVTDDDELRVINAIVTFKKLIKETETLRTKYTDDIGKQKRAIEAEFRSDALRPIEAAIGRLEVKRKPLALARAQASAVAARQLEVDAEAIAETARQTLLAAAAPLASAELDAALAGDVQGVQAVQATAASALEAANDHSQNVYDAVVVQAAAIAPAPVRASMGTASDQIVWLIRVIDPRAVPAYLCSPDENKIRAAIESARGELTIPGVAFEADVETTTRGRRA